MVSPSVPEFQDHFSRSAEHYAAHRPLYPLELFAWLASISPADERALDVGTGNGQAAVGLAAHFSEVIATDASEAQLARAVPHERVTYRHTLAQHSGLADGSVDLVVAATAAHWFDHAAFNSEVERVLRPGGVLAVWHYAESTISPAVDTVMARVREVVEPYWPAGREHVRSCYRTLPFPYRDLAAVPGFECRTLWTADQFLGYVKTWSAMLEARRALSRDHLEELIALLRAAWGDGMREVRWPIAMRVGRKPDPSN